MLANPGLVDVLAADTRISHVDGDAGVLVVDGDLIESLAGTVPFDELCARLWRTGTVDLGAARVWAFEHSTLINIDDADVMSALRQAIAALPSSSSSSEVTAAIGVGVAAWDRRRRGLPVLRPDPALPHARDLLRLFTGVDDPVRAAGLDAYLVAVADHGLNASTFTARVIASTGSDLVSAITGAIGALKGPLHGGAPGPVLDMLDAIGTAANAAPWLLEEVRRGARIMGMGHRIYRVRDPRAAVLERALHQLETRGVSSERLPLARAVEKAAVDVLARTHPDRALRANVEFYTAVLLDVLGFDRSVFSGLFAAGRVAGWCAHVDEHRATGKLVRPSSRYTGPMPGLDRVGVVPAVAGLMR